MTDIKEPDHDMNRPRYSQKRMNDELRKAKEVSDRLRKQIIKLGYEPVV